MENRKLIEMTDFVLEISKNPKLEEYNQVNETFVNKVINYAKFLKQPLQKWMFDKYDERCLFINVRLIKRQKYHVVTMLNYDHIWLTNDDSKTIEDLLKHNLTLTATALKQIEG